MFEYEETNTQFALIVLAGPVIDRQPRDTADSHLDKAMSHYHHMTTPSSCVISTDVTVNA